MDPHIICGKQRCGIFYFLYIYIYLYFDFIILLKLVDF